MTTTLFSALSFAAPLGTAAVAVAGIAAILAGIALYLAIHHTAAANWLRADCAVAAVALYAFAFGRLHVLTSESVVQIIAYSVGFMLASMLEPLGDKLREDQE